ncbi:hypothetical protein V6N11_030853 [Hibiscus sabdariffa]|uniref:Cysteine-rich transmembrane CYSTM domain-containing protein n=1 Tax=Hibiscus sabdariffa TaxID=183260 RepID=A0ABR2AHT6_9ROSI
MAKLGASQLSQIIESDSRVVVSWCTSSSRRLCLADALAKEGRIILPDYNEGTVVAAGVCLVRQGNLPSKFPLLSLAQSFYMSSLVYRRSSLKFEAMSYNHHHVSHQPLTPSGNSSPYPPPAFPPPPSVVYNHIHHSPSPPPGYQGYYYEGYPSPPPGPQPPPLPPRNHYNYHHGCTSFLTGCLATLCCCCLFEDCIF